MQLLGERGHRRQGGPVDRPQRGQPVLYVTERAVFRLEDQGPVLIELAPGMDLERDIFAHMDYRPVVASDLAPMDLRLFRDAPMGLTGA